MMDGCFQVNTHHDVLGNTAKQQQSSQDRPDMHALESDTIFLFISLPLSLPFSLSPSLSLCLSVSVSVSLSVCLSVSPSVCLSVCLPLSLCLSVCLSVCFFHNLQLLSGHFGSGFWCWRMGLSASLTHRRICSSDPTPPSLPC